MGAIFNVLFQALAYLVAGIYSVIPNYAIAIILLTLVVMAITYPLTAKQTRNMIALNQLQPEIKRLQELHKDDKQKQSEELMALYKRHSINPLGGCVPMLLQFPLLIVMFRVIEGLTHVNYTNSLAKGIANVSGVLSSGQKLVINAAPKYVSAHTKLAHDLKASGGHMKVLGFDLASKAAGNPIFSAKFLPYAILLGLSAATQFISTKQIYSRNKKMAKDNPQSQQMMKMQYFMMIFFVWIGLRFQAAVLLYWVVQGVARIGQQWAMYKYDRRLVSLLSEMTHEIEDEIGKAKVDKRLGRGPKGLPKRIAGRNQKGKKR